MAHRDRSELSVEVLQVMEDIRSRKGECFAELQRLEELEAEADRLWRRLWDGPGNRNTVESVGALLDEVRRDG